MNNPSLPPLVAARTNSQAVTSLVTAIIGWVILIIILCMNVGISLIAVATLGIGGLLYLCTGIAGCLSPLLWSIAIFTGHAAQGQMRRNGEGGNGQATAGLVMGYIGLGLFLLSICVAAILLAAGGLSLSQLDSGNYW